MSSIFHISEAAAIGIHAALLMARTPDRSWSARRTAETLQISYDHCVRVLHRLKRGGLLRSVRGAEGGFQLAKSPETISVLEMYEMLEGPLTDRRCLFHTAKCAGKCPLFGGLMDSVNRQVRESFTKTTLAELAGGEYETNSEND